MSTEALPEMAISDRMVMLNAIELIGIDSPPCVHRVLRNEKHMSNKASAKTQSGEDLALGDESRSAVFNMMRSLRDYSKDNWGSAEEFMWKQYLKLCRDEELETLKEQGLNDDKAEKLVEWVWVSRDYESSALVVTHAPPSIQSSFVPAIRVFRDGDFVITPRVQDYLDYHPLLAISDGGKSADGDARPLILRALDTIEKISGLGHIHFGSVPPAVPEDGGTDRRIADCVAAAQQLKVLLETRYLKNVPDDDLEWLRVAIKRERFWRLLDTAFLFGEFMGRYKFLDQQGAEEELRRRITKPPGKGDRINRTVVKMIQAYELENSLRPTAKKLLKWLGGSIPAERGKPLQVDHPLWTNDMKQISWERFQEHVKQAKRKIKR